MERKNDVQKKEYLNFASNIKARFHIQGETKEGFLTTVVLNIKENVAVEGICFVSSIEFEVGDMLELEISLPQGVEPISVSGKIRLSLFSFFGGRRNKEICCRGIPYEHQR